MDFTSELKTKVKNGLGWKITLLGLSAEDDSVLLNKLTRQEGDKRYMWEGGNLYPYGYLDFTPLSLYSLLIGEAKCKTEERRDTFKIVPYERGGYHVVTAEGKPMAEEFKASLNEVVRDFINDPSNIALEAGITSDKYHVIKFLDQNDSETISIIHKEEVVFIHQDLGILLPFRYTINSKKFLGVIASFDSLEEADAYWRELDIDSYSSNGKSLFVRWAEYLSEILCCTITTSQVRSMFFCDSWDDCKVISRYIKLTDYKYQSLKLLDYIEEVAFYVVPFSVNTFCIYGDGLRYVGGYIGGISEGWGNMLHTQRFYPDYYLNAPARIYPKVGKYEGLIEHLMSRSINEGEMAEIVSKHYHKEIRTNQ